MTSAGIVVHYQAKGAERPLCRRSDSLAVTSDRTRVSCRLCLRGMAVRNVPLPPVPMFDRPRLGSLWHRKSGPYAETWVQVVAYGRERGAATYVHLQRCPKPYAFPALVTLFRFLLDFRPVVGERA